MARKALKESPKVDEDSSIIEVCFEHIKRAYENQLASSGDLDSKAASLLNTSAAMVTLIFLSFTYLFGKDSLINTKDISFIISAIGIIICFGLLVFSGWKAIMAYRCNTINDIADPLTLLDLYIEKYKGENKTVLLEHLSASYADAANNYSISNKIKAKLIICSQRCFRWSLIILFIVILSLSFNAITTIKGGDNVAKNTDIKPAQTSRPSDKIRNPALKPMQVVGRRTAMDSKPVSSTPSKKTGTDKKK